jgi:hypothetical protein
VKTTVGRWQIEFDPEATAQCYKQTKAGWGCDCAPCRNFMALDKKAFSPAVLELFDRFGVDYRKPAEIYHTSRLKNGLHDYGGWFHVIGEIESGADAWKQLNDPWSFQAELEPLGGNFSFGFSNNIQLVREPFLNHNLIQLEFHAELPWVLSEPEPT